MTDRLRDLVGGAVDGVRFALRQAVGFRRGPPVLGDEPKDALFDYLPAEDARRAERCELALRERYRLEALYAHSTRLDYRDNLVVLEALEALVGGRRIVPTGDVSVRVVDVGSKNFSYAFALERYFRRATGGTRAPSVLGVELDGHVVYRDLRSRRDYAEAYAAQTENPDVRYLVADFCELEAEPFHVTTLFFPFVTRHALVRWGLPPRFFAPDRLLRRAAELTPRGHLIVFSQTEDERDELVRLAEGIGLRVRATVPIRSKLVHYHELTDDRHGTLLEVC